jgi:hypothetical protein
MTTNPAPAALARCIPGPIAMLAVGPLPASVGRRVGRRVEVDLDAVRDQLGAELSGRMLRYYRQVLAFRAAPTGPAVQARRLLHTLRQREPSGGARVVLHAELAGLRMLPTVAPTVDALLSRNLDLDAVRVAAGRSLVSLEQSGATTRVRLTVPAIGLWPVELGGAVSEDEVLREIVLEANHTSSRLGYGAARLLMQVDVYALERYPDPAA